MPMSFPDMKSLLNAAEVWKFRAPNEGETEIAYRRALADFVQPQDLIESQEIRTGSGWDKWNEGDQREMLARSGMRK
jgi:hypothetical protein